MKKIFTLNNIGNFLLGLWTIIVVSVGVQALIIAPMLFDSLTFTYSEEGMMALEQMAKANGQDEVATMPLWGYAISGVVGYFASSYHFSNIKIR